jgi:homoserine O-acetyltransferase
MELYNLGDFKLECGLTLPNAVLSYKTHGKLNESKDNAILFPCFLGGVPQALETYIGEGKPLDPNKYFIVLPGLFGNGLSSSPSNTPAPFEKGAFPEIHISDNVNAQYKLLTELWGITELQLVLGWSVGALQTYEWAVRYPDFVKRAASFAGAPRPSDWTKLWLKSVIEEQITTDPFYNNGFYDDKSKLQSGLRKQAHLCALTLPPIGFYREGQERWKNIGFSSFEDSIIRFWEAFWLGQDPNDLVSQARQARFADPSRLTGGDINKALARITAKFLVIAFKGDNMFPPEEGKIDSERVKNSTFIEFESIFGHLATFGMASQDLENINNALQQLLDN